MGDVAKRRIRRKLVDWASQKSGESSFEDIVKYPDKKKEGEEVKEGGQTSIKSLLIAITPKGLVRKHTLCR